MLVGCSSESKAYRFWKQGTKTIIKSRDEKFFENIKPPFNAHKVVSIVFGEPFQEDDNENTTNEDPNIEDSAAGDSNPGNSQNEEEKAVKAVTKRARGCPSLERTSKPGRLRKNYQGHAKQAQDPSTVPEILERSD